MTPAQAIPCWNCGQLPRWVCQRCGGTERRASGAGCAECHRRATHRRQPPKHPGLTSAESQVFTRLLRDDFADITVTRPMSAYLEAFTAYVIASKAGDLPARRQARAWRRRLLGVLEGPVQPPAEEVACP